MPKAKIRFDDLGESAEVFPGTPVIEVSEKRGSEIIYGGREGDGGTRMITEPSVLEEKIRRENLASRRNCLACQAQTRADCRVKPA